MYGPVTTEYGLLSGGLCSVAIHMPAPIGLEEFPILLVTARYVLLNGLHGGGGVAHLQYTLHPEC